MLEQATEAIDQRRQRRLILNRDHFDPAERLAGLGIDHNASNPGARTPVLDIVTNRCVRAVDVGLGGDQAPFGYFRIEVLLVTRVSGERDIVSAAKSEDGEQHDRENEHGKTCRGCCSILHGEERGLARTSQVLARVAVPGGILSGVLLR